MTNLYKVKTIKGLFIAVSIGVLMMGVAVAGKYFNQPTPATEQVERQAQNQPATQTIYAVLECWSLKSYGKDGYSCHPMHKEWFFPTYEECEQTLNKMTGVPKAAGQLYYMTCAKKTVPVWEENTE